MIELIGISAGYGKQAVLDGVAAKLKKGRLTSVIGVNGCGKSTLLKATLGILPISCGTVKIDGQDLGSMKRIEIAKKIAYLSQGKNAPDMTVEQMVLHGRFPYLSYPRRYRESDRAKAREAMEAVGLSQLADKPLSALSGGIRQTAYIAMALAQNTDYILLDEPTTYLDISHQIEIMSLLRRLADNGKGIVTVMHDLPMAFDFSDEILVIDNGRTKIQSNPGDVCATSAIKEVFNVQLERLADKKYRYAGI